MKLLFDQNLSHRLVAKLIADFPESTHVRDVGMNSTTDSAVWAYAASHGFVIVSKDMDFQQRSLLYGYPPKVIWIRLGNCTTADVAALLRSRSPEIHAFYGDHLASFLALS